MEIINLGAADGLPPVDWDAIVEKLDTGSAPDPDAHNARTKWLATVNEDGTPHVTAAGAIWLDGSFWFQTGTGTRKSRNVERQPRCSIALSVRDADVVVEGDAARVTDPETVARVAKAWADDGWPAEPDESGTGITAPFNAPSQGPPPWNVYRIAQRSATSRWPRLYPPSSRSLAGPAFRRWRRYLRESHGIREPRHRRPSTYRLKRRWRRRRCAPVRRGSGPRSAKRRELRPCGRARQCGLRLGPCQHLLGVRT
jgi:hypothetical protein